jgi:hypothetical protein
VINYTPFNYTAEELSQVSNRTAPITAQNTARNPDVVEEDAIPDPFNFPLKHSSTADERVEEEPMDEIPPETSSALPMGVSNKSVVSKESPVECDLSTSSLSLVSLHVGVATPHVDQEDIHAIEEVDDIPPPSQSRKQLRSPSLKNIFPEIVESPSSPEHEYDDIPPPSRSMKLRADTLKRLKEEEERESRLDTSEPGSPLILSEA